MHYPLRTGFIAIGLALCASLLTAPAHAQDADAEPGWSQAIWSLFAPSAVDYDLQPTADDFRLDTHASFHQHDVSRGDPRIKAINVGERIYLGENLLSGNNASATDMQSGELYLEFNQRGAELVFRF